MGARRTEVRGVIYSQVENNTLSPDLDMSVLGGGSDDSELGLFNEHLKHSGLEGEVHFFRRKKGYGCGSPVGVPVNLGEGEYGFYSGLYLPSIKDAKMHGLAENVQEKLNKTVEGFCEDDLLVITNELFQTWQEEGLLVQQKEVGDVNENWRSAEREKGREFMRKEYVPALIKAVKLLEEMDLVPSNLVSEKLSANVLRMFNGRFVMVDFGALINTGHNKAIVDFIRKRDEWGCQYFGGDFYGGEQFSVEDLIFLCEKVAKFRAEDDPNRLEMGTDLVGVLPRVFEDEFVGRHRNLRGWYSHVAFNLKRLSPESTYSHLHHIFPRGAAYRVLLTAMLIDESVNQWSLRDLSLLLRGVKVKSFVSDEYFGLFKDRERVYKILSENILLIDRVVNGPYNLVTVCQDCHDLIHSDMAFINQIAGFLDRVDRGRRMDDGGDLIERIMGGEFVLKKDGVNYATLMGKLKLSRFLIMAVGRPYWMVDTADRLLDEARVRTDRVGGDNCPKIKRKKDKLKKFVVWSRK